MSTIERSTRADWRWPILFLVLGVAGAFTARQFFFQAFPEASIELKVPRDEIARRSEAFLGGRGLAPEGFRRVTVFDFSDEAKTYLERELGLEEANRVMATQVHVWRWRTRWVKPPGKEEFIVSLSPAGELVGFQHQVDEAREGPSLAKEEAQRIAEVFLRAERGIDLARHDLVTDELKERPHRLDYTFTWEEKGVRFKEATRRMSVTVLGDQVGEFRDFLKVPEQWTRDYERLRSRNALLQTIATLIYVVLLVYMVVVLIKSSRHRLAWKSLLGIAGVVAALFMANFWNEFGLQLRLMPSNFPYEVWTTFYLIGMVGLGLLTFVYVYFLAASGEPLYRELAPQRVALGKLFTFAGIRSKEFFTSTLIGYGMAGFHIGAVALFYVVAQRLGSWSPLDIKYSNALSTPMPWLQPMSISAFAATTEEFAFRLFAIPLLLKWTRNKWLAILLPAFAWGFLHSGYPQQPAWIRGVEVGLIGVLAGWVFLRFGILATLVWHYTVDAVLIGLFLMRSDELSYRIAGALVADAVLLPLVIGGVFLVTSRGFERNERILNSAVEDEEPEKEAAVAPITTVTPYRAVSRPAIAGLAVAGLLGLVAMALVKVPRAGDPIRLEVAPSVAEARATDHLVKGGVAADRYKRITTLANGIPGPPAEYLREHKDARWVGRVYAEQVPSVFWETRFFRPLQKEEYRVFVAPDGRIFRQAHTLDEKTPGPQLDKPEAFAKAESFLAEIGAGVGASLTDYRLVEHSLEKRVARTDHTLVWESRAPLVGEAHHRISVAVKGGEVAGPAHWIKIPEEWQRLHTRPTPLTVLPVIFFIAIGVMGLVVFARTLPRVEVRWRRHMVLGGVATAIQLVRTINGMPAFMSGYDTTVPWATMLVMLVAGQLIGLLSVFAAATVLAGVAEVLLAHRFGRVSWLPSDPAERGRAILIGVAVGLCGALFLDGVDTLASAAAEAIPSAVRGLRSGIPGYSPSLWPGLSPALDAMNAGIWQPLVVGVLVGLVLRALRGPVMIALGILFTSAVIAAAAPDAMGFVKSFGAISVGLVFFAAFVATVRLNWVAYVSWAVFSSALGAIGGVWRHPGLRPFAVQGAVVLAVVLVAVLMWAMAMSRRRVGDAEVGAA